MYYILRILQITFSDSWKVIQVAVQKVIQLAVRKRQSAIQFAVQMSYGYRRILYAPVRRYMVGVSFLAVFWFMLRTLKYHFVASPNVIRHLWYGYYVPMLFIPLLFAAVSLYLGKSETFRLPIWAKLLLYLPPPCFACCWY